MLYVTACQIGVFALDKDMGIVASALFPKDPDAIRERLHVLNHGHPTPELDEMLSKLKDKALVSDLPLNVEGFTIKHEPNNPGSRYVQDNMRQLAKEAGFDSQELNTLLADIARTETKEKMKATRGKDRLAAQAVASIEDLAEITNLMSERLHEWYGLVDSELERKVKDNESYAKAIVEKTQGEELEALNLHAAETVDLFTLKSELETYLEKTMPNVAPNTTAIAGPILAARLIKHAGGLERLAKLPASTIQLLGAEKALFRFMKERKSGRNARPPKYGLLFTHPYVQHAAADKKGKVARAVAAKLSMAAKSDFYSGENRTEMYTTDLKKKIAEISKE